MKTLVATFLSTLFLLMGINAFSQFDSRFTRDIGFRLGAAYYLGDLSGTSEEVKFGPMNIQFGQAGIHAGVTARQFFTPMLAVEASINYGMIRGTDELSQIKTHYTRNLSFRNNIWEVSARGELHFLNLRDIGGTYRYNIGFSAFGFIGLGMFYHNPKAELNGTWYALQPMQTEGKKYSRIQPTIPLGLGFEFRINKRHIIGWDVGVRKTFTDYLDDVSGTYLHHSNFDDDPIAKALQDRSPEVIGKGDPNALPDEQASNVYSYNTNLDGGSVRGNPENDDWYLFTAITYKYSLKGKPKSFNRSKYHFARRKVKKRKSRARF